MTTLAGPIAPLVEGWNSHDGERVAAAFAPDGVRVEFAKPGARLEGREAIARQASTYIGAVPDCVVDVRSLFREGDSVTMEWTFRGAHTGDAPGFAATGRAIHLDGVNVYTMAGELIREERVYWDSATLYGLM